MELEHNVHTKPLSRDTIKYIAMATMLLNHISNVFLTPGTFFYELLLAVGYFTAPVMCYFLVEGYRLTRSRRNYGRRLLLFGFLSQIPYGMAFAERGYWEFTGLNMVFSLFFCLLLIVSQTKLRGSRKRWAAVGIFVVSLLCDWGFLAPTFTLLFLWAGDSLPLQRKAFGLAVLLFGVNALFVHMERQSLGTSLLYTGLGMTAVMLAGICIVYGYNGSRIRRCKVFSKWFFYLFYPIHLLVLGLLRIAR